MDKQLGYIKLNRKVIDSDIWKKPPLYFKLWCYILMKVNHQSNGNIERSEGIITINELREQGAYYVGYRKVIPTEKQIRTFLNYLKNQNNEIRAKGTTKGAMIDTTKVTHGMLIKVHNYDKYQSSQVDEGNNEGRTKDGRRAEQGRNINNNVKNERMEEINIYCQLVIDYLNKVTGKAFKYSESSMKYIIARLNEGYSIDDCKKVIDKKTSEWKNDRRMNQYLRPNTLFSEKFESYLNAKDTTNVLPEYMTRQSKVPVPLTDTERKEFEEMRLNNE